MKFRMTKKFVTLSTMVITKNQITRKNGTKKMLKGSINEEKTTTIPKKE